MSRPEHPKIGPIDAPVARPNLTTQPPTAPEADTSTPRPWPENAWPTAAELADWLSRCTSEERLSYADHSLATAHRAARCVEQRHDDLPALLADLSAARERVRVVEGERDAARREERMRAEDHANAWREVAIVTARAESAEAAHAALVAELKALCDPANDGPRPYAVPVDGDVLLAVDIDHLRALAGGAR